jgi:hypothetical protein
VEIAIRRLQACNFRQRGQGKGAGLVNWQEGATCGNLGAYGLPRRVREGLPVCSKGVSACQTWTGGQPEGSRRFMPACGSYLAQAVLGKDRYWAAGEGVRRRRREQRSILDAETWSFQREVVQSPEILRRGDFANSASSCKCVNPDIPTHRTGVQPSRPYLRILR